MSVKRAEQVIQQKNQKQRGQQKYLKKQQSQNTLGGRVNEQGLKDGEKPSKFEAEGADPR